MPGYKEVLQKFNPVGLYTFDGEYYNPTSRLIPDETILDESYHQDGMIHTESYTYYGYRAGCDSATPMDSWSQHSLRFCPYGSQKTAFEAGLVSLFPKGIIEIPNNAAFDFSQKEFTYVFMS